MNLHLMSCNNRGKLASKTFHIFPKLLLILLPLLYGCQKQVSPIVLKDGLIIRGATLISTSGEDVISQENSLVVCDSGRIVYAGTEVVAVEGQFLEINGHGKFIIPGLIDSHVHLANIAGIPNWKRRRYSDLAEQYFTQLPRSFLYFGYTTLIDVNNYAPEIIERIRQTSPRPDIYTCGEQVSVLHDFMLEMDEYSLEQQLKSDFLYDPFNENLSIPDSIDLTRHTPQAILDRIVDEQNGICVKTLYEDASSGLRVFWELPGTEIMTQLGAEANKRGIPVILHAPSFTGQQFGYRAGVDIFAHAMWNWTDDPSELSNLQLPQSHRDLLVDIAKAEIGYQSTVRVILAEIDVLDEKWLENPRLKEVLPKDFLKFLHSEEGQWARKRILGRPQFLQRQNPEFFQIVRSQFASDREMTAGIYQALESKIDTVLKILAKHDANFLFGTDNGAMNLPTMPPGYNAFLEMQRLHKAGVSLEQIFRSATVNNAEAFRLQNLCGAIDKNKIANLLILSANPLQDIMAYDQIETVILRGTAISRKELSANRLSESD